MSDDEIKQILRPVTPVNFHIPTSSKLREELREKIGVLEAKNENLLIEKRHLTAAMAEQSEKYRVLSEKAVILDEILLDAMVAQEREIFRLHAILEAIAEYTRLALEPQR